MRIDEVTKKENVNKRYRICIGEEELGEWTLRELKHVKAFDFYNDVDEELSNEYYVSDMLAMTFEEIVDWSKIAVDTKILVRHDDRNWERAYFAFYKDGEVYAWDYGKTSFTLNNDERCTTYWEQVKLYEE